MKIKASRSYLLRSTCAAALALAATFGLVSISRYAEASEADIYWQSQTTAPVWNPVTTANPLPVTGTFTATVSGGTVVPIPAASGGLSILSKQVAANTTSFVVDASPGQLYGIEAFNNGATIAYIKLYNASQGSTTCGSGTPVYRGMIPGPSSGGGGYISANLYGLPFSTAITACVTGDYADNGTTAPTTGEYIVNFYFK